MKVRTVGIVALLLAALTVSIANVQSASAAPVQPGQPLWILAYADQSPEDAILGLAAVDPAYRSNAQQAIQQWIQSGGITFAAPKAAGAGKRLGSPELSKLLGQVKSQAKPADTSISYSPSTAAPAAAQTSVTAAAVNTGDPNTFPIAGSVGSGGLYWNMSHGIYLQRCATTCVTTDNYVANARIDFGATTTRITSQNLYAPSSGAFADKHFQMWAVCRGVVCASQNTGQLPSSSLDYLRNYGDRHGNVLTVGLTLWIYASGPNTYIYRAGKTHDAACESASVGNACRSY